MQRIRVARALASLQGKRRRRRRGVRLAGLEQLDDVRCLHGAGVVDAELGGPGAAAEAGPVRRGRHVARARHEAVHNVRELAGDVDRAVTTDRNAVDEAERRHDPEPRHAEGEPGGDTAHGARGEVDARETSDLRLDDEQAAVDVNGQSLGTLEPTGDRPRRRELDAVGDELPHHPASPVAHPEIVGGRCQPHRRKEVRRRVGQRGPATCSGTGHLRFACRHPQLDYDEIALEADGVDRHVEVAMVLDHLPQDRVVHLKRRRREERGQHEPVAGDGNRRRPGERRRWGKVVALGAAQRSRRRVVLAQAEHVCDVQRLPVRPLSQRRHRRHDHPAGEQRPQCPVAQHLGDDAVRVARHEQPITGADRHVVDAEREVGDELAAAVGRVHPEKVALRAIEHDQLAVRVELGGERGSKTVRHGLHRGRRGFDVDPDDASAEHAGAVELAVGAELDPLQPPEVVEHGTGRGDQRRVELEKRVGKPAHRCEEAPGLAEGE